jgi:polysaccharide biosynthesis protein PslH
MRLLWVGTKLPSPPADGGRLVAWLTMRALRDAGHELTLVAPSPHAPDPATLERLREVCVPEVVTAPPLSRMRSLLATLGSSEPWTAIRHAQPALRGRVEDLLGRDAFDVVHAEQPHALAACAAAFARGLPVVLRAHNVETDLWRSAGGEPGVRGLLARREARRVERWEAEALRRATATVALTDADAQRLRSLAGAGARVHHVGAPFPAVLEPAAARLPGDPAVVLAGSGGWLPNERGAAWFVRDVWPLVASALPRARLHLFGGAGPVPAAAERHPAPADSRDAFAPGSIQLVPLLFASGVRMRILEAWARGVPVVATPAAAAGLGATSGRELLVAATPAEWVDAIVRAGSDSASLAAAGRARLASHHDPRAIAEALGELYGIHR